ncbi:ferritin family protein [Thermoanaerobacterium thermosaccharolyticum]|uniref:rubrerythrin family protein n=1 Tax=Thermoanaerobacterium thermosaccharolyticum TaxID=1517 RepID=UPI003D2741AC
MKNNMTAANLRSAYGGESMAYQRYKAWGKIAMQEGFRNVSRLFNAIAYAEEVHAGNHFKAHKDIEGDFLVPAMGGFGIGNTSLNLGKAISGELFEVNEMYATYIATAEFQQEEGAKKSFTWAREAEKIHADLFKEAKLSVDMGKDVGFNEVHICSICGYTTVGPIPEKCPVCGAEKTKFVSF